MIWWRTYTNRCKVACDRAYLRSMFQREDKQVRFPHVSSTLENILWPYPKNWITWSMAEPVPFTACQSFLRVGITPGWRFHSVSNIPISFARMVPNWPMSTPRGQTHGLCKVNQDWLSRGWQSPWVESMEFIGTPNDGAFISIIFPYYRGFYDLE